TVLALLAGNRSLAGRTVVVSAGGTREALDPVRYVGNRSSGKMGHALANVAARRGARVVLVTTASLPASPGVQIVRVESAQEMHDEVVTLSAQADAVIMAAAVADFRHMARAAQKNKMAAVVRE